jgi:hypothetical protein
MGTKTAQDGCSSKAGGSFGFVNCEKTIRQSGMALAQLGVTIGRRADRDTPFREKRL